MHSPMRSVLALTSLVLRDSGSVWITAPVTVTPTLVVVALGRTHDHQHAFLDRPRSNPVFSLCLCLTQSATVNLIHHYCDIGV